MLQRSNNYWYTSRWCSCSGISTGSFVPLYNKNIIIKCGSTTNSIPITWPLSYWSIYDMQMPMTLHTLTSTNNENNKIVINTLPFTCRFTFSEHTHTSDFLDLDYRGQTSIWNSPPCFVLNDLFLNLESTTCLLIETN